MKRYLLIIAIGSLLCTPQIGAMDDVDDLDIRMIGLNGPETKAYHASSIGHEAASEVRNAVGRYRNNRDNEAFKAIIDKYPADDSYVIFTMNKKDQIDNPGFRLVKGKPQQKTASEKSYFTRAKETVSRLIWGTSEPTKPAQGSTRQKPGSVAIEAGSSELTEDQKRWIDEFIDNEKQKGDAIREALLRKFPVAIARGMKAPAQKNAQEAAIKKNVAQYFDSVWQ
jgi:hypothetical protein